MGFHNVEKWDWKYALLKQFVRFNFKSYFKRIIVQGKNNIPKDKPIIYVPNHQNALMDALAVLSTTKGQPVFLARSDIFKKPLLNKILTFLKMIPIYRIRDGYGNLKMNDEIIQKITDILSQNHSLILFPEGNHGEKRKLRPLKKGVSRIAFQAEEAFHFDLDIQIIPVGLDYTNYIKFNHELFVNYGKPISLKSYLPLYKENPAKAHNAVIEKIASSLKPLMLQVSSTSFYELINSARYIFRHQAARYFELPDLKGANRFITDQKFIKLCDQAVKDHPEEAEQANEHLRAYEKALEKLNLRDWVFKKGPFSWVILFLQVPVLIGLSPVFIYGLLNHILPSFIPMYVSRKLKDKQFWSSIRSTMTLVTFPLFYLIQFGIVFLFLKNPLGAFIYLFTLPISGLVAYHYSTWFKKLRAKFKFNFLRRKNNNLLMNAVENRKKLMGILDKWFAEKR